MASSLSLMLEIRLFIVNIGHREWRTDIFPGEVAGVISHVEVLTTVGGHQDKVTIL